MQDKTSMFNRTMSLNVNFGITREHFLDKGVTIDKEGDMFCQVSKEASDNKTGLVVPPETEELAQNLKDVVN